ncbi:hypothetical protein Tsubulata_022355 [Turnera subulata]|uniref:AIPP2-like SPOC-like domain-containing protein n=1 Tax=Turnera subulata TaxID=218843 RepID=A0A9Q0FRX2_9ROSI|nr:hypothetical protein Tsubulata_022355 [Turnera subulata]
MYVIMQEDICLQCGEKGFEEALISCDKCRTYAVHWYCLDVLPKSVDEYVVWLCCDCEPNSVESSTTVEGPSHLDGENNPGSLIQTLEKKQNRARIGGEKSTTKTAVCSQTKSDLLKPSNSSSLQTFEVNCFENGKKDPELGRQDELQREDFDELVEPLGTKDHALAIPDLHPTEADSFYTDEDHPKPEQQNGVDGDGFCEVFGSLETENPLVPTHGLQLIVPIGCEDIDNNQNRLHEFKFCQDEESLETKEPQLATDIAEQSQFILAQPVKDPIWRGSISIFKRDYGTGCGLVAHLSSIACLKVREEAESLPTLLSTELLPRLAVWPKGFSKFGPRDDCIALYFFPDNERHEKVFDRLVDDIISRDLAMKVVVENAELLIFSSDILPMSYWRIQDKFYLWGVFRGKHPSAVAIDVLPREQSLTKVTTWDNSSRDGPVSSGSYGSGSPICSSI